MVTDHNTLTRLLTQKPADLSKRQIGWGETLMTLANRLRLLYRKGNINEADPLSRRPDFSVRELSAAMTWWNGDLPDGGPKPVFPGDVTDVPGCSVHVSSPLVPDNSELSTDLLDRIRRGMRPIRSIGRAPLFKLGPPATHGFPRARWAI